MDEEDGEYYAMTDEDWEHYNEWTGEPEEEKSWFAKADEWFWDNGMKFMDATAGRALEWAQDTWAKLRGNDEDEDEDEWGIWYEEMGDLVHRWKDGEELTEEEIHRMNELNEKLGDLEDRETGEKRSWIDHF